MNALLLAALLAASNGATGDTIVALDRGDVVRLANVRGEVVIEGWDQDELAIQDMDREEGGISVRKAGSRVTVSVEGKRGRRRESDLVVRIPRWAGIEVNGRSLEVSARGTGAALTISNVRGDIRVEDAAGDVAIHSQQGEIDIVGVTGRVSASSQADDVRLERVRGQVSVHSGDGSITLTDIESSAVEAETQDGDIDYIGSILPGGEYGFFVHDGDATIVIPATSSARVSASTYEGEFASEFPVRVERYTGGREFEFVIGDGGAHLRIQVFDGEIQLMKR